MIHGGSALGTGTTASHEPPHERVAVPGADMAEAVRTLLARGDRLDIDDDGRHLTLRRDGAPDPDSGDAVILTYPGGEVRFLQSHARNEPALGELAWTDLAGEARLLAWAITHESLLTALSAALGWKLLPAAFARNPSAAGDHQWLAVKFDDHGLDARWEGCLGLDAAAARALSANDAWHFDEATAAARRERITLTCELQAPTPRLALAGLRSLAPGDVLMLGMRSDTLASLRLVVPADPAQRIEAATWGAKWTEGALTLTRPLANDAGMTEPHSDAGAMEHPDAFAAIEVIIAAPQLALGRIERLAAGECIPLQHPLDHATVRLRADGANFARGELVTLGDAMGVRIVSIDDSG